MIPHSNVRIAHKRLPDSLICPPLPLRRDEILCARKGGGAFVAARTIVVVIAVAAVIAASAAAVIGVLAADPGDGGGYGPSPDSRSPVAQELHVVVVATASVPQSRRNLTTKK